MCGIIAFLNKDYKGSDGIHSLDIIRAFNTGSKRGPDNTKYTTFIKNSFIGFHRLAINGLNEKSDQPMIYDKIILICNGEIYNYKQLYDLVETKPKSDSDCEVIIHLYLKYGFHKTIQMLDGVFACCLFDMEKQQLYVARDPFGVRPLYHGTYDKYICFSSTLKSITTILPLCNVKQFKPGTYSNYSFKNNDNLFEFVENIQYFNIHTIVPHISHNMDVFKLIRTSLEKAVYKRVQNTDRDIGCLLSGGLDSSLITSLVNKYYKEKTGKTIRTYSIGMHGSDDLKYAKKVANFLNTRHTEYIVSEKEFLNAIPKVIEHIESYDTTTVRASVGNYLLCKRISNIGNYNLDPRPIVIFNGDGSDEVTGGYLYFHYAPNHIEFDLECKRLLNDIHYFDVLRSDRSISSNGLEARTPFLDKEFVTTYLSISSKLRYNTTIEKCEKYLLRKAFDDGETLPKEVLWRTKEAFSDGVSKHKRSWYEIIQEHVSDKIILNHHYEDNTPKTNEQIYFRNIFETHYKDKGSIIPYFWMPKFIDATDASARTLDVYNKKINKENDN
jgi:asparagine synthase (glutamine-hydrolysing)